jgi:ABC-type multidrug transport system ATPase subunit
MRYSSPMPTPALRFRQLVKRYSDKPVLDGVNLDIAPGECMALAGVNGAGKTTLFKCLLDFVAPDSGTIEIFGASHRQSASRGALSYLPERFAPPYYLTGNEFLRTMFRLHGQPWNGARVDAMLAALELDPTALMASVRGYSKGMTQKLGLAACMLPGKALLLLDEPMSGLDPKARAQLKACLLELRRGGTTILFSTHALADVEEIGDRLAILDGGTLRFNGAPEQCRAQFGGETLEQAFLNCLAQPKAQI